MGNFTFTTTGIFYRPEVVSKSTSQQLCTLPEVLGANRSCVFQFLVTPGLPWLVTANSDPWSFFTLLSLLFCVFPSSVFYKDTSQWVFNMLCRFIITFLPRGKHLLISWLQSPSAEILEPKWKNCFHCFPIYLPWSDGTRCHILVFWMLSFKTTSSLSSFTFIKRLFSSSSLSAIRVVSSAYLRLVILLLAILITACASSSLAFLMMYAACKLNKQGDNIQP